MHLYIMTDSKILEDASSFKDCSDNDCDVSSDGLEIDITESPNRKQEIDIEDKRVLENIEEEIERQYDEKAAKSNLSATNVKNILRHVITNEHVWAMVRNSADGNDTNIESIYEPKLTRAKAKELLKTTAGAIPWVQPKPTSEVHILINEELPEDSDDDEYIPHDEESESERESCNTSEIDSQPATPATPTSTHDSFTQTNWTEDGIFKIPPVAKSPVQENDATIALRTRSKLSLSDTPLEIIEEAFIPPDITTDMYDLECDDEDWKDFLKKFTRPLDEAVHETQDDDEADPEYNVLADEELDIFDKEELRQDKAVKISKKELNTLVAELFEFSEMFENAKDLDKIEQTIPVSTSSVSVVENNNSTANEPMDTVPPVTDPPTTETLSPEMYLNNTQTPKQNQPDQHIITHIPMTIDQLLLLEQQMRQHVQLLTQSFVLTFHHPDLYYMANNFKDMLLSFNELSKYKSNSVFKAFNLEESIKFIDKWEKLIQTDKPEVEEMKNHVIKDYNQCRKSKIRGKEHIATFPKLILQHVSESPVFIYPSLLPRVPFRFHYKQENQRQSYIPSEDELIAIGLEQFIPELDKDANYRTRFGKPRLSDVAFFISKYMLPLIEPRKLYARIKTMNDKKLPPNPIKFYFANKKAPTTIHYVQPLNELGVVPPCLRPPSSLPYQWKAFIYPQFKQIEVVPIAKKVQKPPAFNKRIIKRKRLLAPKNQGFHNNQQVLIINNVGTFDARTEVTESPVLIYENINKIPRLKIPIGQIKKKSRTFSNKGPKNYPKFEEIFLRNDASITNFYPENNVSDSINEISEIENRSLQKSDNSQTKLSVSATSNSINLQQDTNISENSESNNTLEKSSFNKSFSTNNSTFISPDLLKYKFNSSLFSKFKNSNMLPSMPFLLTPVKDSIHKDLELSNSPPEDKLKSTVVQHSKNDETDGNEQQPKHDENDVTENNESDKNTNKDDEDDLNALMIASTTIQQKNKRIQSNLTKKAKQMKEYNATLTMLCPENKNIIEEKAKNYAQAYYDKVQERLENESPLQYQKFMEALSEHDEANSTVSDLYEKVSSVLSPKHPDLCEEFLTFLTAEQAQQIGKLVPHFMMSNMSLFLRKLELYYNNQPAQLRRIYNCLTELADTENVSMEKVRATILPLLKGNALLIDWFLQMFPKEPPPESLMTDWEQLSCDDGEELDDDEKAFETITLPEVEDPYGGPNCICKCHKIDNEMYANRNRHCIPCGTKFLQGRVYVQTGKGLRLANVTFNNSTNLDHSKRLSVKPFVRQKRKSETSSNKGFMSPPKDDEPRHSNESEDDINVDNISTKKIKSLKSFQTNSPTKSRKKSINKSASNSKVKKEIIKSKQKTETVSLSPNKKSKLKPLKNNEDNSNELLEKVDQISPSPDNIKHINSETENIKSDIIDSESIKAETTESETEVTDWDVKTSPGPSVESTDTCEESSQDTVHAQGSESDDSIIEELESAVSDNSDDSNDDTLVEQENNHLWTRDEDKVILETFQQSGDGQNVFKEIQQHLPNRTVAEIKQRFHVLMSLLQEMASDVTE